MKTREAAVAGSFYPANKEELAAELNGFLEKAGKGKKSRFIISPHAGYAYSGRIAARAFKALEQVGLYIIIGPNHTGLGERISISDASHWKTPLGKAEIDVEFRKKLLSKLGIDADDLAHIGEHSCEVQIPFIQTLFPNAKILPISVGVYDLASLELLGKALFEASKGQKTCIIASSDFSHFLGEEEAKERDLEAIKFIEKMDWKEFHSKVVEKNLSICGFAPITTAMILAEKAGMKKGTLIEYTSSAETTGDTLNVVGYAAVKFE